MSKINLEVAELLVVFKIKLDDFHGSSLNK
jgi:hypothetical protein